MVCPICTHIVAAPSAEKKCSQCGLPAEAARAVIAAREQSADAELSAKYARATAELQKVRRENSVMKDALCEIQGQMDWLKTEGLI
jgi:uncharacterized protein YecT (DUF1311 family)